MGLYSGPTSMEKTFVDPFGGNYAKQLEAHMEYLKNVSPDEKVSGEWMRDMMTSEILYITQLITSNVSRAKNTYQFTEKKGLKTIQSLLNTFNQKA